MMSWEKDFDMKKIIQNYMTHPLFSGSFFMIVGSNLANFIAYIYHLILGRLLGPSSYGELVATLSLIGLIMSLVSFFGLVIVKFVSSAKTDNVSAILDLFNRKTVKIALLFSVFVWIVSPFLGGYVHLPKNVSLLFAPILFISIISYVYKSFLQGTVKFKEAAIVTNIEISGRLVFGLLFILLNMSVFGATLGIFLGSVCGLLLAKFFLKNIGFVNKEIEGLNWKKVFSYALPVFVVSVSFTSLLTADLVMVKHFFSSYDAGIYGSVSNLGKIIFYGTAPIGSVMFPLIAKKKSQNLKYKKIFALSIVLVLAIGLGVLFLYYLFPNLAIKILYGNKYLEGTKYLILMGVYYIFYSLANLISSFFLSIDLTKPVYVIPAFSVLQIILIYLFHSSTGWVITVSIASVSLLLIYLGLYFVYEARRERI